MQKEKTRAFQELIYRWGSSISELVLDTSCCHFDIPEIDGFIGYRIVQGCAVVLGDPICANDKKAALAQAFQSHCQDNKLTMIFFIASEEFSKWAIENICKIMIEVGEEVVFDPFFDPTSGHKGAKLRNTIHHAQNLKLSVQEYIAHDEEVEKSIVKVGTDWLKARKGPQIYLSNLNFFDNKHHHRWFYLQDDAQKMIGMALLSRLNAYQGWFLKYLIVVPEAPRGASELLMISILETLRREDCHFLTYGMIPADHLGEIVGLGTFSKQMAKIFFKMAKWIFHLGQRKLYWHKFRPQAKNSYLLFSGSKIGFKELKVLANTMKIDF